MIAHTNLSFSLTFAIWSSAQVLAMVLLLCFVVLCFLLNLTLFVEFLELQIGSCQFSRNRPNFSVSF